MERGLKLVLSERLVIDASRTHHAGTFSEKRTAHVKCRWITEASLLLKNPFFPMLESLNRLSVTLPIFFLFFFFSISLQLFSSGLFRLPRVSCRSYHRVMCWVTHLASPGMEVPCPASTTIPNIFFNGADWIEIFRWPSLVPPEKNQTDAGPKQWGEVCLSSPGRAGVPHGPAHGPLSTKLHHSIYQLSINQQ